MDCDEPPTARPLKILRAADVSERYHVGDELGDGAYARVVAARHIASGEPRALKMIDKRSPHRPPQDAAEAEVLWRLRHPHIVRMHEVIETDDDWVLAFDKMDTDLYAVLAQSVRNQLPESEVCEMARQLLSAVAYLHKENVVHRDIKPENVLLRTSGDNGRVVALADFGFARVAGVQNDAVGTSFYMPPEAVRATPALPALKNSKAAPLSAAEVKAGDVWSLGVVLYFALAGCPPFVGKLYPPMERRRMLMQMDRGPQFGDERWRGVSDAAQDVVRRMLCVDVSERVSAEEALRSAWFRGASPHAPPRARASIASSCGAEARSESPLRSLPVAVQCPA